MGYKFLFLLMCISWAAGVGAQQQQQQLFNNNWEFVKDIDTTFSENLLKKKSSIEWEAVSLPHTANIEPVEKVAQQWQGICFYRKFFTLPATSKGAHIAILFEAAMQEADVYVNGQHVCKHLGGYLPFYIDVSNAVKFGAENSVVVKLDNRDNPLIPPGKPIKDLDFNYYSGIYRNAYLITKNKLHLTNAVAANKKGGGGVFIHYEKVDKNKATLVVQTDVKNEFSNSQKAQVRLTLKDSTGKVVAQVSTPETIIDKDKSKELKAQLSVGNPQLWWPDNPYLYQLSVEVLSSGKVVDKELVTTGIKTIRFEPGAFYLNGEKLVIRGTNRHQEYPFIGYAASDNAQYRDAWKIKEAGFNFVRSSHYPQSPAYLDACDELGILVMDAIPGWQFVGGDIFQQNSFQDMRDMIRRDRNHPSIILWETSLNESGMKRDYMEKAHQIVHEEIPFEPVYSAGWINDVYDVFLPARQHAKAPDYWKNHKSSRPFLIAEYGDWEYYAQNAGFNQTAYKDLQAEERTSRQLRGFGEKRLLQQALNFQEAHNDNLETPSVGDANWLMFDYNRGYAPDIESSGIMDMMRLPKFAFYFYKSLVHPVVNSKTVFNQPVLFIANYWSETSDTVIKVYSNCNEVELIVNGKSMGRQKPGKGPFSTHLDHPPFTFSVPAFVPGTITAKGYIDGKQVVQQERKTPGAAARIQLRIDESGKYLQAGVNDVVFVYADIVDANGTVVYSAADEVELSVKGDAEIVGLKSTKAEAGTAAFLIKAGKTPSAIELSAVCKNTEGGTITITSKN